ncbi:hypothetical protein Tco_0924300 [Tanacetum coccineum]|uniref:Uncharacterized protein n=1 Tax=Tanacetum coccineum TaxID=301880 RepID=A0ABQ5D3G1_9ASTR
MADQDTPPPTITAIKIPIIKKGEYDIWSMRMRQCICHTNHNILQNNWLRRNQERIKSILLLAIPDEYLFKFHNVPDAKSLWAEIKSRFGVEILGLVLLVELIKFHLLQVLMILALLFACTTNNQSSLENKGFSAMDGRSFRRIGSSMAGGMLTIREKNATTVIENDILLENVDLEESRKKDPMVTMAEQCTNKLNLHPSSGGSRCLEAMTGADFEVELVKTRL